MPTHKTDLSALSVNQLALVTGKSHNTVKRLLTGLASIRKDGRTVLYATREALEKIYLAEEVARVRLDRLRGDKVEAELLEKDGTMVHVKVAADLLEKVVVALRSKLLTFPTKAAPAVCGCRTVAETKDVMETYLYEAMTDLANLDVDRLNS